MAVPVISFARPTITPTASPVQSLSSTIDAFIKGAETAKVLPSTAGAIAEGLSEFGRVSQEVRESSQREAINEQVIEQNKLKLEKQRIDAQTAALTRENELAISVLDSENKLKEAEQKKRVLTQRVSVLDKLQSGDPSIRRQVLTPKFAEVYSEDPEFHEKTIESLIAQGDLTPEEIKAFTDARKAQSVLGFNDNLRSKTLEDFTKVGGTRDDFTQNAEVSELINNSGLSGSPEAYSNFASGVSTVPAGKFETDPETGEILLDDEGKPRELLTDKTGFDVFYRGKKINNRPLTASTANLINKFQNQAAQLGQIEFFPDRGTNLPAELPLVGERRGTGVADRLLQEGEVAVRGSGVSEAVVSEARQGLIEKAQQNPRLKDRLIQKGIIKSTEDLAKTFIESGTVRDLTPETRAQQTVAALNNIPPTADRVSVTPKVVPTEQLPAASQKVINESTVKTVSSEPLLKNEPPIIKAIAAVESGGKRGAVSPTGVRGLLQVTEATAESLGFDRNDPVQNIAAGKAYLGKMLSLFDGNAVLALAAYNGGPGTIRDAIDATSSTVWTNVIEGLRYLNSIGQLSDDKFKEVKEYPGKVLSYYLKFGGGQEFEQANVPLNTQVQAETLNDGSNIG